MTSHVLHLGDCLDPVSGLASLPDKSVDHVISDPPYEAEAHTLQCRATRSQGVHDGGSYDNGGGVCRIEALSFAPITEAVREDVARELARVVRRWVVVFCQVEAASKWASALALSGLVYKRTGIWVKPDGMPQYSGDRPGMGYESIVIAHARGRSQWNGGGRHGVWTYNKIGPEDRARTGHETQKPLDLMLALVRDFTDPGETILDPFAGSGTTGVACKRLGRSFIGWERDPKYHAAAVKRIAATREQLDLLAASGPAPKPMSLFPAADLPVGTRPTPAD